MALRRSLILVLALTGLQACRRSEPADAPSPALDSKAPQSEADLEAPLAVVDGVVITVEDFQRQINEQSPYLRPRYEALAKKKQFLETMIRFELLAKEAERRGYDRDADVVRAMKQVMIQKLMVDQFETKIDPNAIPEAELRAYFEAHREDYNRPSEIRASAIIMSDAAVAAKVAAEAKGEAGATQRGFRDLVAKYSVDTKTKERGGDLRYFTSDTTELPKPVVEAAFQMTRTGEVVGPIAAEDRFYVLKQTGKRSSVAKDFDAVKASIQNRLYRDKRNDAQREFIDSLKAKAKIEINEANLEKVRVDTSKSPVSPEQDGHQH